MKEAKMVWTMEVSLADLKVHLLSKETQNEELGKVYCGIKIRNQQI